MAEDVFRKISEGASAQLGWYVYLYLDPRDGHVFYVGKGKGNRALRHLRRRGGDIHKAIKEMGCQPRIEILAHGFKKQEEALHVEAAVIDLLGLHRLANRVSGLKSGVCGRVPWSQLGSLYPKPRKLHEADIAERVILIRINRLYYYGMSAVELYDATRGVWIIDVKKAKKVKYAFAVFRGVVREVFEPVEWLPAGTTFYGLGDYSDWLDEKYKNGKPKRWEFVGRLAPEKVRKKYVGCDVSGMLSGRGDQNAIRYVGCWDAES